MNHGNRGTGLRFPNLLIAAVIAGVSILLLTYRVLAPVKIPDASYLARPAQILEAERLRNLLAPERSSVEDRAETASHVDAPGPGARDGSDTTVAEKALQGIWSLGPSIWPDVELPLEQLWSGTALSNYSWRFKLHSLFILHDLVLAHRDTGDPRFLETGTRIIESWIQSNPRAHPPCGYSWSDHTTANRALAICAFVDYCVENDVIEAEFEAVVVETLFQHGRYLAHPANYTYVHNHGVFQDFALIGISTHLGDDRQAREWASTAVERLGGQIRSTFSAAGVHLENSPGYHFAITELLERIADYMAATGLELPGELENRIRLARAAFPAFVMPDGHVIPVGDTTRDKKPPVPIEAPARPLVVYPDAGYARLGGGMQMYFMASHNSPTHKHCDDLSFVLCDAEGPVISDVGLLNYESGSGKRAYTLSWDAHNVVTADSEAPLARSASCGIEAYGASGDYAFVRGRSSRRNGLVHERSLLYDRSEDLLVIVDRCSSPRPVQWRRLFHFEPGVSAESASDGALLIHRSGPSSLRLVRWPKSAGTRLITGQEDPLQGWVAQPHAGLIPAPVAVELLEGADVTFLAAIGPEARIKGLELAADGKINIDGASGLTTFTLERTQVIVEKPGSPEASGLRIPLELRQVRPPLAIPWSHYKYVARVCHKLVLHGAGTLIWLVAAGWAALLLLVGFTRFRYSGAGFGVVCVAAAVNVAAILAVWSWFAY